MAKCVEQGVVPGPMLGRLKNGEDVALEDGRVIRSLDVVGQSSPASSYLVIDLPEVEYLDSLEASERLRNIKNLNFEFYLSFTIVAAVELPADLFNIFGVDWIGRRWTAALSLLLCGLTMLVCAFTKGRRTRIFERLI